jgi:hypothetical protein
VNPYGAQATSPDISPTTRGGGCRGSSRPRSRRRRASARAGLRLRDVDDVQDLRTAEAADLHGSHDGEAMRRRLAVCARRGPADREHQYETQRRRPAPDQAGGGGRVARPNRECRPASAGERRTRSRCERSSFGRPYCVAPSPASRPLTDTAPQIGGRSLSAAAARRVSSTERVNVTFGTYHLIRDIALPGDRSEG